MRKPQPVARIQSKMNRPASLSRNNSSKAIAWDIWERSSILLKWAGLLNTLYGNRQVGGAATLCACAEEVIGSNICQHAGFPYLRSSYLFLTVSGKNDRIVFRSGHGPFLPNRFQIIIPQFVAVISEITKQTVHRRHAKSCAGLQ
jgi:hypothetical protein